MTEKKSNINTKPKNQEFLDLCAWVEREIFGYEKNMHLQSKRAILTLVGLKNGQQVANNSLPTNGKYSDEIVLLTFKAKKYDILNALKGKSFDSESQKMNYVCAIVRDGLNNTWLRVQNKRDSERKIEMIDVAITPQEDVNYQPKTDYSNDDMFEGLW